MAGWGMTNLKLRSVGRYERYQWRSSRCFTFASHAPAPGDPLRIRSTGVPTGSDGERDLHVAICELDIFVPEQRSKTGGKAMTEQPYQVRVLDPKVVDSLKGDWRQRLARLRAKCPDELRVARALGLFRLRADGTEVTAARVCRYSPDPKRWRRGFFDDWWGELRIEQPRSEGPIEATLPWDTTVEEGRVVTVRYALRGKQERDPRTGRPALRLAGKGELRHDGKAHEVAIALYAVATDDMTLRGHWWHPGVSSESEARNDLRQRLLLRRLGRAPSAPQPGIEIPIEVENAAGGYDKTSLKLWVPWQEIEQEFLSEVERRLRGKHDRVYLELALAEASSRESGEKQALAPGDRCAPENCVERAKILYRWDPAHYVRYPIRVDGALQRELALEAIYAQAFLYGVGLWEPRLRTDDPGKRKEREWYEIRRTVREHAYYVGPMFLGRYVKKTLREVWRAWNKGLERGMAQREATQCSLVFRFAAAGYEPDDRNPFPPQRPQHAEFACYQCWKPVIDEAREPCILLEGAPESRKHAEQAGRVWVLPPWPHEPDDPVQRGRYEAPEDFDPAAIERIVVPSGRRVVFSRRTEAGLEQVAAYTAGRHRVAPGRLANAQVLLVESDNGAAPQPNQAGAKWLEDVDPARIREAYLRGRQAHRIVAMAAVSAAPRPPAILVGASRFYGLAPGDVEALFASSWAAARIEREQRLVFSLASLGLDPNKSNPFARLLERADRGKRRLGVRERQRMERARDDFERYRKLHNQPRYRRAYERGRKLHEIFRLGKRVGSRRTSVPNVYHRVRLLSDEAGIDATEGERIYERGYEIGRRRWLRGQFRLWQGQERETIRKTLERYVTAELERGSRWPEHRYYVANPRRSQLAGIRHKAIHDYGLPSDVVDRTLTRQVLQMFKLGWENYSRTWYEKVADAIVTMFTSTVEYAGLIGAGLWSWVEYGAVLVGLVDEPESYTSDRYIDACVALFGDRSALGWVVKEDWAWYQGFARLFLGIGNVFLLAGVAGMGAKTAWVALRGVSEIGWRATLRTIASGSVQWARQEGRQWLLNNGALSGALGLAEEASEFWILDEEFSLSDAIVNSIRNAVTTALISGLSASFTAMKLEKQFRYLLLVPQGAGILSGFADLAHVDPHDPEAQQRWRYALLGLVNEAFGAVITAGAEKIGQIAARKVMEDNAPGGASADGWRERCKKALEDPELRKAFEKSVEPPKTTKSKSGEKLPFDPRNPKEIRAFVTRHDWSRIEAELRPHLKEYAHGRFKGRLRAGGEELLQSALPEFLASCLKDPGKLARFFDEVGGYRKLTKLLERGVPSRSDAFLSGATGQRLADRLLLEWLVRKGADSRAVAGVLAVECADGWPGVLRVRERLPKTNSGALTPEGETAFGNLLVGYLEACKSDPDKLAAMLKAEAPTFHQLERIESWLPRDEHGLPTARARNAWGEVLVRYLEQRVKTDEEALRFYKEVGGWDNYLRPLETKLPRGPDGELTPQAKKVWGKLHQARTNLCETLYKEVYASIKAEYGVELIPPGGDRKYFIGTPPGHPKFKGVNSDLDFNLTFAKDGAKQLSFVDQELILIEAKRRLEAKLRARFDDPGIALDTNVYVRIDGFPVEQVSKRFWQARERYWDMVKLRFGCEDDVAGWQQIKALIRRTVSREDKVFVEAYLRSAEKRYADFEAAVQRERKAIGGKWNGDTHEEVVTALARQRVIRKMEDELIAFLKNNREALAGSGKEADQLRALYNARKQDYISMLPETYMSKASLDKVVVNRQVTLLERIHAKVDQIRYLLVKFHHTHGKPATYRLWKLAKYEMRKLKVDDIERGELYTLLDTLKGAKTHDEAIAVLKKRYGAGHEAKAKQLVGEIRQRIDRTLEQWAELTRGALTDRTLAPWKDYVPKPTVDQVKKMEE